MLELLQFKKSLLFSQLRELEQIYEAIEKDEEEWKKHSPTQCPSGCGQCCIAFEPDLLEIEADYLALWLIQNDREKAEAIADQTYIWPRFLEYPQGCFLFDPTDDYHCTVYEGRALICRLFGYTSDTGRDGKIRWKPCKYIPEEAFKAGFVRKQYTEEELHESLVALPPVMSHYLRKTLSIQPDNAGRTTAMRDILPKAIQKMLFLLKYIELESSVDNNPDDTPTPTSPIAA